MVRLKRALLTLIGGIVFATVVGWLMFQRIPAWYRPIEIDPAHTQEVLDDFIRTSEVINTQINGQDAPFQHTFSQDQINQWLGAREKVWPLARKWLPPMMSHPCVTFEKDTVCLASTIEQGGVAAVFSTRFNLAATPEGLWLKLTRVSGGVLALPRFIIQRHLAALEQQTSKYNPLEGLALDPDRPPTISQLPRGVWLKNEFVWENGNRPYRITHLKFAPGKCTATFEPLANGYYSR